MTIDVGRAVASSRGGGCDTRLVADAELTSTELAARYKVEIPFSAATNGRLAPPIEFADGARVIAWVDHSKLPDGHPEKTVDLFIIRRSFTLVGEQLVADAEVGQPALERRSSEYAYCLRQ